MLERGRFGVGVAGRAGLHGAGRRARRAARAGGRRHRDRPRPARRLAGGGRLCGLRGQRPGGQPLPPAPHHLGRQVGCRRRQAAGRPGAHRRPQPPPAGRRLGARRARSGCWRGRIRALSGAASASSTGCAQPCATTSRPRCRPKAATWPRIDAMAVLAIAPTPEWAARSRAPRSLAPWPAPVGGATCSGGRPRFSRPSGPTTPRRRAPWPMLLVRPVRRAFAVLIPLNDQIAALEASNGRAF